MTVRADPLSPTYLSVVGLYPWKADDFEVLGGDVARNEMARRMIWRALYIIFLHKLTYTSEKKLF